jgi:hypothetical protein
MTMPCPVPDTSAKTYRPVLASLLRRLARTDFLRLRDLFAILAFFVFLAFIVDILLSKRRIEHQKQVASTKKEAWPQRVAADQTYATALFLVD